MSVVNIEMPEEMVSFVLPANKEEQLKRNAMMLYPYVHDGIMTDEEIDEELSTAASLKEVIS